LSAVEYFSCGKVLEVLVVRENLQLVNGAFAVSSSVFESIDDGKKFLVVDFIVDLRRLELPGVEGDWVQAILVISLGKDSSEGKVRRIRFDDDRPLGVEVCEDRRSGETEFKFVERSGALICPFQSLRFSLREFRQGTGISRVIPDEASVDVSETQKGLGFSQGSGVLPVKYRLDLFLGHFDTIMADDISQELNFGYPSDAFFGRYSQLIFLQSSKDFSDDVVMFLNCFGIDEEVIHVGEKSYINHLSEDRIYYGPGRLLVRWSGRRV
jgi:hypothetical protein